MNTAMILAAGRGERLRPLTDKIPKPLLKVGGKPLLQHQVERLYASGCENIVVNCAWLSSMIKDFLGSGQWLGVSVTYSDEGEQAAGIVAGVRKALPLLGAAPFMLVNSDILCDYPRLALSTEDELARLLLVENPPYKESGDFLLHHGKISSSEGTSLTYSGAGCYRPEFFQTEERDFASLVRTAAAENKVSADRHSGYWIDVGTSERLHQAEQFIQQHQV